MSCNGCLLFKDCYDMYPDTLKPPCASKNFERNDSGGVAGEPGTANNESFQLLCKRFVNWCDKEGDFKVDDEFLQLVIDMRSATKNIS